MSETNGHDPMAKRMVEILESIDKRLGDIATDLRVFKDETRGELLLLHEDVAGVRGELHAFKEETREGFAEVDRHLEKLTDRVDALVLDQQRDGLASRVARLEAAVFKPAAE